MLAGGSPPNVVQSQPPPAIAPIPKPPEYDPKNLKPGQIIGLLFVVGVVIAGLTIKKPDGTNPISSLFSSSPTTPSSPPITVSANSLFSAYKANEVAADSQYKDKTVIVDGTVQSIAKDILDNPYVVIGGDGFLDGVQCVFPRSDTNLGRLSKGQQITVRGKVTGKMGNVLLHDCSLQ